MAGGNRIHFHVCDLRLEPRVIVRISEELDAQNWQIAILCRSNFNHPPQEIQDNTCICVSCNRRINAEIREVEQNEECFRLNVMKQRKHGPCIFCNRLEDFVRLSAKCRVNIFTMKNIYVPK